MFVCLIDLIIELFYNTTKKHIVSSFCLVLNKQEVNQLLREVNYDEIIGETTELKFGYCIYTLLCKT